MPCSVNARNDFDISQVTDLENCTYDAESHSFINITGPISYLVTQDTPVTSDGDMDYVYEIIPIFVDYSDIRGFERMRSGSIGVNGLFAMWYIGNKYGRHVINFCYDEEFETAIYTISSDWIENYDENHPITASYSYDCGNGFTAEFKINISLVGTKEQDIAVHQRRIAINENNFPDDIFRQYVLDNFDRNDDKYLSGAELSVININVDNMGIESLKGIEHFHYLWTLRCSNNMLTELDVSNNSHLYHLECDNNHLSSINAANGAKFTTFSAENNICEINTENNVFTLSELGGFNASKASNWSGAVYNSEDNTITITTDTITYDYDCGNGHTARFTLIVNQQTTPDLQTSITAVNSLFDDETNIKILTDLEMKMIEIVLENDYNKAA